MHLGGNRRWVPLEKAVFAGNRHQIIGIITRLISGKLHSYFSTDCRTGYTDTILYSITLAFLAVSTEVISGWTCAFVTSNSVNTGELT